MRRNVASEASFKCAIDQRSGAIGISRFTRSKMPSKMIDRAVRPPVHRDGHAALGGPAHDLVVALLVFCGRRGIVVHRERDALAKTVEVQPVVAEAHRQQRREALQLVELLTGRLAVQAVRDAHRELVPPPHVEQRLVVGREQVVAAGIDDAREPEPVQLAEERLRAGDLIRERRLRQPIEQRDDRALPAADRARELLAVALELAAGRQIRIALDTEFREAGVGHHGPAVTELHVHGVIRRRGLELGLRGPAPLGELQLVPAARHDQPRAGRHALCRRVNARHRFRQRARTDPVHFGRERQRRANRVQVRIDEPRDHGAAAEIDDARGRARELADLVAAAEREHLAVADRERFLHRRARVDGHDLAVHEHEIGRLRERGSATARPSATTSNERRMAPPTPTMRR